MTLNITLAAKHAIYQSTDFRLTNTLTKTVASDSSPKQVEIIYDEFTALITYTGLGTWNFNDTSQLLTKWIAGKANLSYDEMIAIIKDEGDKWLRDVFYAHGEMVHSFIIAGYVGKDQRVTLISNYETLNELSKLRNDYIQSSKINVRDEFMISEKATKKPLVIITGNFVKVDRMRKKLLVKLLSSNMQPARVMKIIADINRCSSVPGSGISPSCQVSAIFPDNTSSGIRFGDTPESYFPYTIFYGNDVRQLLAQHVPGFDLKNLNLKLVQRASNKIVIPGS